MRGHPMRPWYQKYLNFSSILEPKPLDTRDMAVFSPDDWVKHEMTAIRTAGLPPLESLAMDVVLNTLAKDQRLALCLHTLPHPLFQVLTRKLTRSGLPLSKHISSISQCEVNKLDLTCHCPTKYPFITPSTLHKLQSNCALRTLILDDNLLLTSENLKYLSGAKNLKTLSLSGCSLLTDDSMRYLSGITTLKHLSLARLPQLTSQGVAQLISHGLCTETLDLSYTGVDYQLFRYLTACQSLKSLNLDGNKFRELPGLEDLLSLEKLSMAKGHVQDSLQFTKLILLRRLSYLNLEDVVAVDGTAEMWRQVFGLPLLKDLYLPKLSVYLPDCLRDLSARTIKCLHTGSNVINDEVLEIVSSLHRLQKLHVRWCQFITHAGIERLHTLSDLRSLTLNRCSFGDEAMIVLRNYPLLNHLDLYSSQLGDEFLLSNFLQSCQKLESLDLGVTGVTDKGLAALQLNQLSSLILDGCAVSVAGGLSLSGANCPKLHHISLINLQPVEDEQEEEVGDDELNDDE